MLLFFLHTTSAVKEFWLHLQNTPRIQLPHLTSITTTSIYILTSSSLWITAMAKSCLVFSLVCLQRIFIKIGSHSFKVEIGPHHSSSNFSFRRIATMFKIQCNLAPCDFNDFPPTPHPHSSVWGHSISTTPDSLLSSGLCWSSSWNALLSLLRVKSISLGPGASVPFPGSSFLIAYLKL